MKKIFLTALLTLAVLTGFTSCDQGLFGTNIFAGFESFDKPSSSSADDLLAVQDDDRFFEEIEGDGVDDTYVAEIIDTLELVPVDDPEFQEANLMLADVYLAATGADQVFDEFNSALNDFVNAAANGTESSVVIDGPSDIVGLLFDTTAPAADIKEQLSGLLLAADALNFYGSTLDGDNATDETPPTANAGDIAAQALVAGVVDALVQQTITDFGGTEDDALNAITNAILTDNWTSVGTLTLSDTNGDGQDDFTSILGGNLDLVVTEGLDLSAFGL